MLFPMRLSSFTTSGGMLREAGGGAVAAFCIPANRLRSSLDLRSSVAAT